MSEKMTVLPWRGGSKVLQNAGKFLADSHFPIPEGFQCWLSVSRLVISSDCQELAFLQSFLKVQQVTEPLASKQLNLHVIIVNIQFIKVLLFLNFIHYILISHS